MSFAREMVKKLLLKKGAIISRPPGQFNVFDFKLRAARRRGLEVRFAVDGGAADGGWARSFRSVYPGAGLLCVEPREAPILLKTAQELGNVQIERVLLGADERQVDWNESGDQSSVLDNSLGQTFGHRSKALMTTLDKLVAQKNLPQPDLIKLDLQGYELEALRGAEKTLKNTTAVLMEVSFISLQAGCPLIADVIGFMDARAFRLYDITGLWHRPLDGALAQGDMLFLSENSVLLAESRWGGGQSNS